MCERYGSARNGKLTMLRYTHAQLSSQRVIDEIRSRGFKIYGLLDTERVSRELTQEELQLEVFTPADRMKVLHWYHANQPNGFSALDDRGKVVNDNLPEPITTYMGEWDPVTNTPRLSDKLGKSGQQYYVAGPEDPVSISLGGERLKVKDGDYIMHMDGKFSVSNSNGLSKSDRHRLENSMQTRITPEVISPLEMVNVIKGKDTFLQLMIENMPRGEFALTDTGGLKDVYLHPMSGELYMDTTNDVGGDYTLKIAVGSSLGQKVDFEVFVRVVEGV